MGDALPDPVVAAEVYDEDYYRSRCAGHEDWEASGGAEVDPLYEGALRLAGFRPGEIVVDVGAGRGELVAVAASLGAERAIGVEYSAAAVALSDRTLAAHGAHGRAEVHHGDARALPVADATADLVTMLDVVEHLAPAELDRALEEALRVLRPGGRILVHTLPNRLIYDVTYRVQRLARPGRRRRWPADPRNELERTMHVNEQSARSLRAALRRAGFSPATVRHGAWMHTEMVPDERARRLYHRLARHRLTRALGAADLWGEGRRPA